jgi:hypothetical protein
MVEKRTGKTLALIIILGVFVAIMLTIFVNLVVSYLYEGPVYEDYCSNQFGGVYPVKYGVDTQSCQNCTFSKELQEQTDRCYQDGGNPVYDYDSRGCTLSIKECNLCNKDFESAQKVYNRQTFFIYAIVGFALVVFGLFISTLLLQIVSLPAGAFLVIEAATKNFDDKLFVIIVFGLLIIAALYLALKKLKLSQ